MHPDDHFYLFDDIITDLGMQKDTPQLKSKLEAILAERSRRFKAKHDEQELLQQYRTLAERISADGINKLGSSYRAKKSDENAGCFYYNELGGYIIAGNNLIKGAYGVYCPIDEIVAFSALCEQIGSRTEAYFHAYTGEFLDAQLFLDSNKVDGSGKMAAHGATHGILFHAGSKDISVHHKIMEE